MSFWRLLFILQLVDCDSVILVPKCKCQSCSDEIMFFDTTHVTCRTTIQDCVNDHQERANISAFSSDGHHIGLCHISAARFAPCALHMKRARVLVRIVIGSHIEACSRTLQNEEQACEINQDHIQYHLVSNA